MSAIIAGYDDTRSGHDALELAVVLADLDPDCDLIVAHSVPGDLPEREVGEQRAAAERTLAVARACYGRRERTWFTACRGVSAADGLSRLAEELSATTIVVGTEQPRGLLGAGPARVIEPLMRGARRAVAVAPRGYASRTAGPPRTIAIAHDGCSDESEHALAVAAELARAANARLEIVGVVEYAAVWYGGYAGPGSMAGIRDDLRERLELARQRVADRLPDVRVRLLDGDPAREIAAATRDVDLLVLGPRGLGRARRAVLGSVSGRLVVQPACPLLAVSRVAGRAAARPATRGPAAAGASAGR